MTPPAPPCRLDIRRTASRAHRKADHIGLHDALQPRGVHLLHPHLGLQDAGVVHQRGDRSQLAVRGAEQGQDAGFGRHIRATATAVPPCPRIASTTACARSARDL